MPIDIGAYFDKLRTQFQAGGGDIDIIIGDVIWPAQFAVNGWVSDLSDRFKDTDEFLSGPMQSSTYEDKVWAVPWYTDAGLLYYRQDLLEKSGYSEPPATWDDLMEMAAKVQKDEGIKNGFVYQGADYEGGVCNGLEYIRTNGGDVLDPNDPTKVIIESSGSVNGLATWRETIESGVSPQAVLQYLEDESAASFLNGESVFIRNWPYMYSLPAPLVTPSSSRSSSGSRRSRSTSQETRATAPWRMELPDQRHLRAAGRGMGVHRVDNRPRATGDERSTRLPPANQGDALRRSRVLKRCPSPSSARTPSSRTPRRGRSPPTTRTSPWNSPSSSTPPLRRHLPRRPVATLQEDLQQIVDQGEEAAG